jgi:hypothetical protein
LTYARDDLPAEVDITTCSLDNPELFPPSHHLWTSHAMKWLRVNDDLPGSLEGSS